MATQRTRTTVAIHAVVASADIAVEAMVAGALLVDLDTDTDILAVEVTIAAAARTIMTGEGTTPVHEADTDHIAHIAIPTLQDNATTHDPGLIRLP